MAGRYTKCRAKHETILYFTYTVDIYLVSVTVCQNTCLFELIMKN